jgi:hypothetical protein
MTRAMMVCVWLVAASSLGCKSETIPVGGACDSRDDCKNRVDCMKGPDGKGVCTISCTLPTSLDPTDSCPAPTKCTVVNLSVEIPDKTVNVPKAYYCLPKK